MLSVEIIDPLTDARWTAVERLPGATLYHSTAWGRVIAETYGFRPRYSLAVDRGEVIGGLPCFEVGSVWRGRRLVSLPFSDVGGPVGDPEAVGALLAAVMSEARQGAWRTVEIRGALPGDVQAQLTEVQRNDCYTLALDRPLSDVLRGFSDSVRWGRNRALRDGVTARRASNVDALREFYHLHQLTRRKLGVPVQPWRFFQLLADAFIEREAGFVVHACHSGRPIASAVFLRFGARLYYKFSAADPRHLALQPNSLVLWEAIAWATEAGLAEVDLGKTVQENAGLARFKRSWGAVPVPLPHYYFPRVAGVGAESEDSTRMRALRALWRRLPLPVARLVGGLLYRALA